jgi:ribonuclease P protein component
VKRKFRLTRSTDIKRVRRQGKSYAHPLVVLVAFRNEQLLLRFGIIAGRSVGGAVQRNRSKRLLRAALDPMLETISPGWDIILLARQPLSQASMSEVHEALTGLFRRAQLFRVADVSA